MKRKDEIVHNIKYNLYELGRRMGAPFRKNKKASHNLHNDKKSTWLFAYGILALPILYFIVFYVYVNFNSIMLAFRDVADNSFTLGNFRYVIKEITRPGSGVFVAIKNTAIFWLLSWILMPIQIIISFLLYKHIAGYKVFQTIFYLPTIIGGVVWMTAFKNIIMPDGPFCKIMVFFGVFKEGYIPELLANSKYALSSVIASSVWLGIPGNMLIYCGTLTRIPQSVIEAAKLDGVGFWKEIWYITIPFLGPLLGTQVLLLCTGILSASGNILLLTEGRYNTTTLSYWLYDQIVVNNSYNVPAAMGILMMLVTLPVVIVARVLTNKIDDIEY